MRELRAFILQKVKASVVERQKKKFCYSSLALEKKTLLYYSCQLEIDHMTQQPKETCQRTCRGPMTNLYSLSLESCINPLPIIGHIDMHSWIILISTSIMPVHVHLSRLLYSREQRADARLV